MGTVGCRDGGPAALPVARLTPGLPIGECQWLHLDLIKEMRHFCKSLFPVVDYAYCSIPTYPSGQIGFMLCSKNPVSWGDCLQGGVRAGTKSPVLMLFDPWSPEHQLPGASAAVDTGPGGADAAEIL